MPAKSHKNKIWEVDSAYRDYVSSHYPEAIEFIRKNVTAIRDKGNIWFDVQEYTEFSNKTPDGSSLPGTRNIILFKKIVFDIFPRKQRPHYMQENVAYNRYITWKTATEDIRKQRAAGYNGNRWIVECQLDIHKAQGKMEKVYVPETAKFVDNPAYSTYLKTEAYRNYRAAYQKYETRLDEYKTYRRNFQEFHLPDGTVKRVLLYMRSEEKFEMLRTLGVAEAEIQESRKRLEKPEEPVPPQAPSQKIKKVTPGHYEERMTQGKWIWNHTIKSVRRR